MEEKSALRLTRSQGAYARLANLAHRMGPDAKLPTVVELRETLGVSKATLDGVLAQLEQNQIINRKHGVGIFVSSQLQRRIALLCPLDFAQRPGMLDFWAVLVQKAQERAAIRRELLDFHFVTGADVKGLQQGLRDEVCDGKIHGIVAMGVGLDITQWLVSREVPVVGAFAPPLGDAPTFNFEPLSPLPELVEELRKRGCHRIEMWQSVGSLAKYELLSTLR